MARPKTIGVKDALQTLLPRRTVDQFATEAKVVQRRRKLDVAAFFWTLVLGFGTGEQRVTVQPLGCGVGGELRCR